MSDLWEWHKGTVESRMIKVERICLYRVDLHFVRRKSEVIKVQIKLKCKNNCRTECKVRGEKKQVDVGGGKR